MKNRLLLLMSLAATAHPLFAYAASLSCQTGVGSIAGSEIRTGTEEMNGCPVTLAKVQTTPDSTYHAVYSLLEILEFPAKKTCRYLQPAVGTRRAAVIDCEVK